MAASAGARPARLSDVPLASRTTLGVGGPAWALAEAEDAEDVRVLLGRAEEAGRPVLLLGGGSNVLVADAGFPGLVIQPRGGVVTARPDGGSVLVRADAGLSWDGLVAWAVERDLAGIECLSGIPGLVGAAPMQNIGAYGQEVGEVLVEVEAVDRRDRSLHRIPAADCGLGYRTSRFKHGEAERWVVTAVTLRLRPGGGPALRYAELQRFAEERWGARAPSLAEVRGLVLAVRRSKSMVLDPDDPNTRSAGSFFTNPIVDEAVAAEVRSIAEGLGLGPVPAWPASDGVKLAAAWLIERAGFGKGYGRGPAGLSTRHCLALVNRDGATAADLVALAGVVRRGVRERFGVTLQPEPVFVGFDRSVDELLG